MIQSFKMAFDTSRISTQKIREIIEELTKLGVYDSKIGIVSYDNDDKVLEQKIIGILDNIVLHIPEHTRSLSGSLLGYKTIP